MLHSDAQPQRAIAAPSRSARSLQVGTSILILVATAFICLFAARLIGKRGITTISPDTFYVRTLFRYYVVMLGTGLAAFAVAPTLDWILRRLSSYWRRAYTVTALSVACVAMSAFVIVVGRWQFGAFDYNILIDVGWRQILGQRPYTDFVTTTPPGFNLGMKLAFELFGVSWNANLYFSALFTCTSFLWLYWLMVRLGVGRLASTLMAIAIECAVMLDLCFWWYNNTALMLAAIFFLACCLYAREPLRWQTQLSYCGSLVLLSLMKPNIAGLTAIGGFVLVLIITDRKLRLFFLTLGASVTTLLILVANRVSIPAMLATYRGASLERGGFTIFAYDMMNHFAQRMSLAWVVVLSLPLLLVLPRMARYIRERDWRGLAWSLLLILSSVIAFYGLATNGELREVECSALLGAGALIMFGTDSAGTWSRRAYIAVVVGGSLSDLYLGAIRSRVYTIGPQRFFEWTDARHRIDSGFLKDMRVSARMVDFQEQVARAKAENQGPFFLGPRVDFNYAVLGLPSPEHFALWWHPGTAFARRDVPQLLEAWQASHFQTLIFLKDDYTFYPPEFMKLIEKGYVQDDRYPQLTVYHARREK